MTDENEIVASVEVTTPGLIFQAIDLDRRAEDLAEKKKSVDALAKGVRDQIMQRLQAAGIKSATHESGYRATIVQAKPKIVIVDEAAAIKSIKKAKMTILLNDVPEQVIKAHVEVNMAAFEPWAKASPGGRALIEGIEEKEAKPYLRIAKGEEE